MSESISLVWTVQKRMWRTWMAELCLQITDMVIRDIPILSRSGIQDAWIFWLLRGHAKVVTRGSSIAILNQQTGTVVEKTNLFNQLLEQILPDQALVSYKILDPYNPNVPFLQMMGTTGYIRQLTVAGHL